MYEKKIKSSFLMAVIFYTTTGFSQQINIEEMAIIENRCRANNQKNLQIVRAFGDIITDSEMLLQKCINNALEVAVFNTYNKSENIQELYSVTISKLESKLVELSNINSFESNRQYSCFEKQIISINFASHFNEYFLKRSLITANNLLRTNCVK